MKKQSSKRSQMRIMEMSFMIVGIAVFFLIVGLFWLSVSMAGLRKEVEISTRAGAIMLVAMLAGSPEFGCADSARSLCVDADKLLVLKEHTLYARFWQIEGLEVRKMYPYENRTIECSQGNYPRCNVFTIKETVTRENLIEDSSWVSICREEYKNGYNYEHCELGKIVVYSRKGVLG